MKKALLALGLTTALLLTGCSAHENLSTKHPTSTEQGDPKTTPTPEVKKYDFSGIPINEKLQSKPMLTDEQPLTANLYKKDNGSYELLLLTGSATDQAKPDLQYSLTGADAKRIFSQISYLPKSGTNVWLLIRFADAGGFDASYGYTIESNQYHGEQQPAKDIQVAVSSYKVQ